MECNVMAQSIAAQKTPFLWEGTNSAGKRVKGKSTAASEAAVRAQLRREGVVPTKVRKESTLFQKMGKVTPADIAIFSRQLATMLSAGIPLVQAFEIVGNGHDNPAMRKLIGAVKTDVEGGTALAQAMSKHPLHFDDLFVNLVEAGEQAGALETLLDKIATYKEKTEACRSDALTERTLCPSGPGSSGGNVPALWRSPPAGTAPFPNPWPRPANHPNAWPRWPPVEGGH